MSKLVRINEKICIVFTIFLLFLSVFNISTVSGDDLKPDLIINYINCPDEVIENDTLLVEVKITNDGEENISWGTAIEVGLYVDNVLVSTGSTSYGLNIGASVFMNLSWVAKLGSQTKRLLRVIVDYQDKIPESNEDNNIRDKFIDVIERDTELEITEVYFQNPPRVNETVNVYAKVRNNGKDTENTIYSKLTPSKGDVVEAEPKKDGLSKGESHLFEFEWIPSDFGSQKIKVEVYFVEGNIEDSYEKTVFVDVGELEWWNSSWHYRHFLGTKGSGNISLSINFTEFLEYLNLYSHEFENDTIRIIEYYTNGTIAENGEVKIFKFNESVGFNKYTNSKGTLIWNVTGSPKEKYYCIYFDVKDNPGYRTDLSETDDMIASGDVHLNYSGFVGGWFIKVIQPANCSYCLVNESIDIIVETLAKAENVSAYIFWNIDESYNFTIYLNNDGENVSWSYENFYFDKEGNWTIRIQSIDKAGYQPALVEYDFYIGKPDLKVLNISFTTNWPPTSPIVYKNDIVTITTYITSYNATVDDVEVSILIYDLDNNVSVYNANKTGLTIIKDEDKPISFDWTANKVGNYNVTIKVDPKNLIDEFNESNNRIIKNMVVYGWPDLGVERVYVPITTVTERENVRVDAEISNYGDGDATGYSLGLCIESVKQGSMSYSNVKKTVSINVKKNTSKTISLTWNNAEPGEWFVGVKIIPTSTKRDTNILNNQNLSDKKLTVRWADSNPPQITNVLAAPETQEQGGYVTISAIVTDDSGVKSVTVKITSPKNKIYTYTMTRTEGNTYSFVFEDTIEVGTHNFEIKAVDISIHNNSATETDSFVITEDSTPPTVTFFGARPSVQLKGGYIDITCIATDNTEIKKVEVTIIYSDFFMEDKTMAWSSTGKYEYSEAYDNTGKYRYYVTVTDRANNMVVTNEKVFWITLDKNDTDNDGMPDWWESRYELNPKDPEDARLDKDGDGYTNLKEYEIGTNPAKNIFIENAVYRVKDNILYLFGSVLLFIFLIFLIIFSKWRKSR